MFYLLRKNQLSEYEFDYLNYDSHTKRLDDTKIHGKTNTTKKTNHSKNDKFCIEIMAKNVIKVDKSILVVDAYKKMLDLDIRHLPIVENNLFVGVISLKDLLPVLAKPFNDKVTVADVMSTVVLCCSEETSVRHLGHVMVNEKLSSVVVVDTSRQVCGIVSYVDLLRAILEI